MKVFESVAPQKFASWIVKTDALCVEVDLQILPGCNNFPKTFRFELDHQIFSSWIGSSKIFQMKWISKEVLVEMELQRFWIEFLIVVSNLWKYQSKFRKPVNRMTIIYLDTDFKIFVNSWIAFITYKLLHCEFVNNWFLLITSEANFNLLLHMCISYLIQLCIFFGLAQFLHYLYNFVYYIC